MELCIEFGHQNKTMGMSIVMTQVYINNLFAKFIVEFIVR